MKFFSFLNEVGFFDLVDIVVMSALIYWVLAWFKKTRAAFVLTGILIVAGFYLIARQFNLFLTASVFQGFFAVILVAVVVIFQEELRHLFEKVAVFGLRPRFGKQKSPRLSRAEVAILVRTLNEMAKSHIGGIIVIRGKDMILRHLEGGEILNGKISEALLQSLFDPHSEGHDGAVIVEGDKILSFGVLLPLSKNFKQLGKGGTRHAAALGISELTDALCLVVSEEKGTISIARHGEIHTMLEPEQLSMLLEEFYQEMHPHKEPVRWSDFFRKNLQEKGMAIGVALLLWFFQVHGSKIVYHSFLIPIEYAEFPEKLTVSELEPNRVEVTFSGPRRSFYFLDKNEIRLNIKTWQIKEGVRIKKITASDFDVPKNLTIENIEPSRIKLHIEKREEELKN